MRDDMWQLYDALIEGIPDDLVIEDFIVGSAWTMVKASGNTGVALTVRGRVGEPVYDGPVSGGRLKTVAACVKSWNFTEASLGMAAINSYYNEPSRIRALGCFEGLGSALEGNSEKDAFKQIAQDAIGKKVAVIGRFPHLEDQLEPICQLSVLERNPDIGDFPDSACEYILPEQDIVFITGMTLTNKTLPRLLQIVQSEARVIMVGPSVPMTALLYRFGITDLSGFCVTNPEKTELIVKRGDHVSIFKGGAMVSLSNRKIGAGSQC
jgi:uncharacterized protein (DUF4213/DUF364 family)